MSCRWTCGGVPAPGEVAGIVRGAAAATYLELARARREEDFRWFARSQGMTGETIEALWRRLRGDEAR